MTWTLPSGALPTSTCSKRLSCTACFGCIGLCPMNGSKQCSFVKLSIHLVPQAAASALAQGICPEMLAQTQHIRQPCAVLTEALQGAGLQQ